MFKLCQDKLLRLIMLRQESFRKCGATAFGNGELFHQIKKTSLKFCKFFNSSLVQLV